MKEYYVSKLTALLLPHQFVAFLPAIIKDKFLLSDQIMIE